MRVRHPKLPCKILVHAYSRAFPKTTASYAQLFLPSISGSHVYRRISTLTTYSKVKLRAIERAPIVQQRLGENTRTRRGPCLWFLGRCSASQWRTSRNIFLHSESKTRGRYPRLLSLVLSVQSRRKKTTRSRTTVGTSYRTRFPRRRMQDS